MSDFNLVNVTVERLIKYINDNDLQAGEKLPNEVVLGDLLQIGRSTLREAVKSLASRNILEVKQGAGTFVANEKIGISSDPLGLIFIRDKRKLAKDLMEIRMMIEPQIAAMAAVSALEDDVVALHSIAQEIEWLIHIDKDHTERDIAFHRKIAESSGNLVVPNLLPIIQQGITIFVDMTNRTLLKETIETHRDILAAIAEKKPEAARDAMTLHLVYNRARLDEIDNTPVV
ncbi:MAG: FadR/GntR family transcriptional regulator [Termitinemataceae bacterium]|nr:MAG: FadR/GntR family transcriptional regulator [Termitinemataceae bacterium]